jgi:ABC-2 type transport system permease protein
MLLLMCPLVGYSFFQAVSLYGEASAAGLQSPVLASSLSPWDGILAPTLRASYVAVTLLFPFVGIRARSAWKRNREHCVFWSRCPIALPPWSQRSWRRFWQRGCYQVPAFSALAMWRLFGGTCQLRKRRIFSLDTCSTASASEPSRCLLRRFRKVLRRRDRYARLHDGLVGA